MECMIVAAQVKRSKSNNRVDRVLKLDGRTAIAQALRAERAELLASLPQPIDPATNAMVEQVVMLGAHLAVLNRKCLREEGLQSSDVRLLTSANLQRSRLLRMLRTARSTRAAGPTLSEYLATRGAAA